MPASQPYTEAAPTRAGIDRSTTLMQLDFGTDWCVHCQAAQPLVDAALHANQQVVHVKVEDGKGRPLGRAYGVTLWPTLVFLRAGIEVARLVRPTDAMLIKQALAQLSS